jgi:hypothetical protein
LLLQAAREEGKGVGRREIEERMSITPFILSRRERLNIKT